MLLVCDGGLMGDQVAKAAFYSCHAETASSTGQRGTGYLQYRLHAGTDRLPDFCFRASPGGPPGRTRRRPPGGMEPCSFAVRKGHRAATDTCMPPCRVVSDDHELAPPSDEYIKEFPAAPRSVC